MYERSYGYLYEQLGTYPSAADIAKAIRNDIKTAKAEGLLPARWSYSVRSDNFAGGCSIDVEVRDCADAWQAPGECVQYDYYCGNGTHHRSCPANAHRLTEEAEAAKMTLERIHGAYNHDGSEIQVDYFDVRYYGHVQFEDAWRSEFRREEKARTEARKAQRAASKPVSLFVNYTRNGKQTHVVMESPEGKKALACGARTWSRTLGDMVELGSREVDCSRCAKHI